MTTAKYANERGYTDVKPWEVIKVVSDQTLEIRLMDAEKGEWKPEWHAGGFAGHCSNQHEQVWNITSNKNNPVIRIRRRKNPNVYSDQPYIWCDKYGQKYDLEDKPVKFYDYNF
jgi:hypothetical protein